MKRKIFSIALCSAMLMNSAMILHAEDIPTEEPIAEEELIYPAGSIDHGPVYETNMGGDEQGSLASGINVEYHSKDKIREFYNNNHMNFIDSEYSVTPSTTAPFAAGKLTDVTMNEALKTVNLIRYIAGLNYNVNLKTDYSEKTQAGALLNAVNQSLSQTPSRPNGMDTALYNKGYTGNQNSSLASGNSSLSTSIVENWLSDASETSTLTQRRWLLNSAMAETGFGQVGLYSGMYTHDTGRTADRTSNVWPAQNTPVELFSSNTPWSVSTGNIEDPRTVKVTLIDNNKDDVAYVFSANDTDDGFFAVDNHEYGVPGAIIWKPNGLTYKDGDSYDVVITNLVGEDIRYTVNFFTLDISQERVVVTPEYLYLDVNKSQNITATITPSSISDSFRGIKREHADVIGWSYVSNGVFKITGLQPGKSYFKILTNNDVSGFCYVTVKGILLNQTSLSLQKGQTASLAASVYLEDGTNKTVTWTSSNSAVASVNANGVVTANKSGTATITASAGGYTASATVTVEAIDLKAVNLTLTGNIGVNFSFDIPDSELNDTYVSFTLNGNTNRYSAADAEADENGWLRFSALAAAKEMRDTITVRVENEAGDLKQFESSGSTIEGTFDYSVEKYFKSARKNYADDTKLMNLINAMDTYGKYAQIKFDHVTDGMGTPDTLGTVNLTDLNQFKPVDTGSVTGITVSNISLGLETDTVVKPYFTVAAGHNINEYVIKADNAAVELIDAGSANTYYAQLKGVAAADLDQPIKMVITNKNGTETESITYYPLSYVRSVLKNSASYEADLVDVCKALYFYWVNAEAYFSN